MVVPLGWVLSRLFGIRDLAYLTAGIRDFRGKRNGDPGWNYESDTGIGQRKFGKPDALKNDTSLNLETRSKHLWILTIFLDKDGHLPVRTMEKYGLLFCSWVQSCTRKEFTLTFSFSLWHGPLFVQILLPWQRDIATSPLQFSSDLLHWEWRGILQTAIFRPCFHAISIYRTRPSTCKYRDWSLVADKVSLLLLSKLTSVIVSLIIYA